MRDGAAEIDDRAEAIAFPFGAIFDCSLSDDVRVIVRRAKKTVLKAARSSPILPSLIHTRSPGCGLATNSENVMMTEGSASCPEPGLRSI